MVDSDGLPFVALFKTEKAYYVYDANTSRIVRVSAQVYKSLQQAFAGGPAAKVELEPERESGWAEISALQRQGLLLPRGPRCLPIDEHRKCIESRIRSELSQLTLEVTEDCNLRCAYCIYGAGYENQRSHGSGSMPLSVADQGLHYFYDHNKRAPFISVGFYGGEPLVAFDTIKAATGLVREYKRGHETHLHLTTNGTLLTREKFPFFVENGFALLVSVDGPKAVHDRFRRNRAGRGTWAKVMKNLQALRDYAPGYYDSKVMFSCVRVPATSMDALLRFFSHHPLVRRQGIQFSGVSDGCPELMSQLVAEVKDWSVHRRIRNQHMQEYLRRLISGRTRGARFGFLQSVYGKSFVTFHRREICDGPGTSNWINGMCIPAWRKLFVGVDGTLYSCERVGRAYPIGHVSQGLDFDRVFEYLLAHKSFTDTHCRSCWAIRLCGACQSTIGGEGGVDPKKVRAFCDEERRRLADIILLYVRALEVDPQAFDFLETISIS